MVRRRPLFRCVLSLTLALALETDRATAQVIPPPLPGTPTATVAAGSRYKAGAIRRFFLGSNYRDLWSTPITVPVLDLRVFAGGLKPTKISGSTQTMSLRFKASNGSEFVFRSVDKDGLNLPTGYYHTVVENVARGQVSSQHPAGAMFADVLLTAAGVLHPTPILAVMPDDSLLGEFREDFAGRLGMIEPYPSVPDHSAGFAGAIEIIDSDSLQVLLDADPREQVDALAYLTVRLVDMFMNDWDRHPGNWKWARMSPGGMWQPIARDRDRVMTSYGGLPAVAGLMVPQMIRFQDTYPPMGGLTWNSIDLDRRLLDGLDASAFDSIAVVLVGRLTDSVIESALRAMPSEYDASLPVTTEKLRARRDLLPAQAAQFYCLLSPMVDIHGTDAADSATITLVDNRHVEVEIRSGHAAPYYRRRFDASQTREVRLYLHEGDDHVDVRGVGTPPMRVRVIGGNGTNQFIDASNAADRSGGVRFYNSGTVSDVQYGSEPTFDRRPWINESGTAHQPGKDWGAKLAPGAKIESNGDELGLMAALGLSRTRYGFGRHPYASRASIIGVYSAGVRRGRVVGSFDKRREASPLHVTAKAYWSELELIHYYGFGNDSPEGPSARFEARQQQWMIHPALAFALGPRSDIAVGPIFKSSATDDIPGSYLSETKPYGSGDFNEAGVRLGIYKDNRIRRKDAYSGVLLDLTATAYPKMADVTSSFQVLAAIMGAFFTLPMVTHPVIALKAGAKQVFGDFPFHEAAFIGGEPSQRDLPHERFAGDAALYGSVELRVPVVDFAFILPIDIGVYTYGDAGRVFVERESPDGWHNSKGAGVWIGILNPFTGVSVDFSNYIGRNIVQAKMGFTF